jgi:hypothetical protein
MRQGCLLIPNYGTRASRLLRQLPVQPLVQEVQVGKSLGSLLRLLSESKQGWEGGSRIFRCERS